MMRHHRYLAIVGLAVIAAAGTPAHAASKKPIVKNYTFTDRTPDPTIDAFSGAAGSCSLGKLPMEKPIPFKVPAAGSISAEMSGYTGDWAIEILSPQGEMLSSGDGQTPLTLDSASTKVKKPGTYKIFPCNITGTLTANVKVTFKYK